MRKESLCEGGVSSPQNWIHFLKMLMLSVRVVDLDI
jgi:hypothetical protein